MWTSLLVKSFVAQARPGRYRPPESCAETLPLTQAGLWPQVGLTSWCSRLWQPHAETSGVSCSKHMTPYPIFFILSASTPCLFCLKKRPSPPQGPCSPVPSSGPPRRSRCRCSWFLQVSQCESPSHNYPQPEWLSENSPVPGSCSDTLSDTSLPERPTSLSRLPLPEPSAHLLLPHQHLQSSQVLSLSCPWRHKAAASTLLP